MLQVQCYDQTQLISYQAYVALSGEHTDDVYVGLAYSLMHGNAIIFFFFILKLTLLMIRFVKPNV